MSTLKELFPNIIILCLDKRITTNGGPLHAHVYQRFGIDSRMFVAGDGSSANLVYNHIDVPHAAPRLPGSSSYPTWLRPSCYNAFLCQQKMAKLAKDLGWSHVLFLEDDMFFEVQTEETLAKLGEEIKNLQCDLLYVGFCAPEYRTDLNREDGEPQIMPAGQHCGGFHCVAIHSRVYDNIINMPALAPMDAMVDNMPNRYAIVPKLGEQKPGYSYVEQVVFTRESCARKLARLHERWPHA
jgi:hypothetical protein